MQNRRGLVWADDDDTHTFQEFDVVHALPSIITFVAYEYQTRMIQTQRNRVRKLCLCRLVEQTDPS